MKVQAEISLYPLQQKDLSKPIAEFVELLEGDNLKIKTGPMSTFISGQSHTVFNKLNKAFEKLAQKYDIVLTAKISNACPDVENNKQS